MDQNNGLPTYPQPTVEQPPDFQPQNNESSGSPQEGSPQAGYPQCTGTQPADNQPPSSQPQYNEQAFYQAGYPQAAYPQPPYPSPYLAAQYNEPASPQAAYPQAAHLQPRYPQAPCSPPQYNNPAYPQAAYPQAAYIQPTYPQPPYPPAPYTNATTQMAAFNIVTEPKLTDDEKINEDTLKFLQDNCWAVSCWCCGFGFGNCCPCSEGRNKCLCLQSANSSNEDCCGPMGFCLRINKTCCILSHSQFPPDECRLACCNIFCCGPPPSSPNEARNSLDLHAAFDDAFWCYYCFCEGLGLTGKGSNPMWAGQSKCCTRFEKYYTTDCCGERGCISINQRSCCCACYKQCPPDNMTPGCGCCGVICCCDNRESLAARQVRIRQKPVQQRM